MDTPPTTQSTSRSSTGAFSQQSTLAPSQAPSEALKKTPSEALRKALDKFCLRLSADELSKFKNTTFESLRYELSQLQQQQAAKKEMMNLSRIQAFLEGMQQLTKTIEVFLNASNFVAFVWGPMKFLLLTASVFTDTFETLLEAYEQIGEQLPLLPEYESLFGDNQHLADALQWIFIDILTFHQHAIRFFQGKKLKHIFRAMWKSYDTEFQGILSSLRRHKDLVERRASVAQYRKYREDMIDIKMRLDQQVQEEKLKKLVTVREWLAVDQRADQDHLGYQNTRKTYSTTAQWVLKHENVEHWIEADPPATPLLWMHGIPGAGKTILASAIIDKCKDKNGFLTSYFYCHDGDQSSSSAISILKGLADQLLEQYQDLLLPSFHTRRTSSGDASLRSLHQAKKLLEDCCSIIPKLFIVVDGLDECDPIDRKETLDTLTNLVGECNLIDPGKLRILVVSQNYPDIHRAFHTAGATKLAPKIIPLSELDVENDIKTYVRFWVDKIAAKNTSYENPFSEDMKEYLRNLTLVNAKGMFLYAKLVLENLFELNTREKVIHDIQQENFPQGLKEAYKRIVNRIKSTSNSETWKDAKKLLGWMVCAKRQLTWKEIQVALSIDIQNQTIEYDDKHMRAHVHDICGSLVFMSGDRVSLVHSTAKTYITKVTKDIHEPSIECELAVLCLQYLTFPCFISGEDDNEQDLRRFMLDGHFAFQDYAVAKWFHHVNAFVNNGQTLMNDAFSLGIDLNSHMDALSFALYEFIERYDEEDWESGLVEDCKSKCSAFADQPFYEHLLLLTSHIYTFQQKGFEARHKISLKSLDTALERNRKLLEEFPAKKPTESEKSAYRKFYDEKRRYKCTKITCRYFSQGFTDIKAKKRHINIHDRPYQCEVSDCLGAEGFANEKDLKNHTRSFHPEMSDLAETFKSSTVKRAKADFACIYCGKTFTRKFHQEHHQKSHKGIREHECPECGKAFTRRNDLKRHQKLHERGR
ncbi:hypothetical protein GQ44DRAFT_821389 [Phaeosphaeriaceae sp. PMI808]|nr:hypothetical protein GQ44DRAFT_821389 [Phaeosphaeriaceae sp. PMI808]